MVRKSFLAIGSAIIAFGAVACSQAATVETEAGPQFRDEPLVSEIYTADPSTHVWEDGRIYIYASHDVESGIPEDDLGSHFNMRDYQVLSMDRVGGPVTVHPVALDIADVPWAGRQMWAPDAAYKDGTYYLYFPAKDKEDIFRIGVATSSSPVGPFTAQPQPIQGSYSMDPNVFRDSDGTHYMYFGGIWGGQLQRWQNGVYDPNGTVDDLRQPDQPAIMPRIARMANNMLEFAETPREVMLLDEQGNPILGGDNERRFFEGAWVFKRGDTYYFTYSTGDTHFVVYATGTSPYGPFTYRGRVLEPVQGWTSHHSITEINGQWYLSYHDTQLSGQTHLRNVKMTPLTFNEDGTIQPINPFK
ncbi:glycoside hydrolase family 43 protein [Alteraurantiacibacter palmitatis]|uniref:Glycoside hydrolase family 43 protein n=1 Tax=Alteraurantiacibacter palmitatis TaxID=2054628 RepID=A0ABV7E8L5_9SPHN